MKLMKLMKFRPALLCLLFLAGAAAARAQDVSVDFDRSNDFSKFKTYSWADGVPAKNPLIDQQIRSNIEGELAARGLRRVEGESDLRVLYMVAVDRDIEFAKSRWSTTGDWASQMRSGISVRSQTWDVEVGTLVVFLTDASDKQLLWRGTASTMLDKRSNKGSIMDAMNEEARKAEKRVRKSVEKMFKQYPVAKAKP
ncbi:MAG TPA: DUF4136 domain-containing protein [Pyrinomonadaceae bacterium]|nr:DUF4136 domain-containing protein [Pyrinomonadaceae bacterium]